MPMTATNLNHNEVQLLAAIPHCLTETNLPLGNKYQGKVRDIYDLGENLLIVATDRLSAFDRTLAAIPYKGQVLNLISAWWFAKTKDIVANHLLSVPDECAALVEKCRVFPIEFVVRGYITGTTQTSLWTQYKAGVRNYCGNSLPEGLVKNAKLECALLTPTTKDKKHDKPISPQEIVHEGWLSATDYEEAADAALRLFAAGTRIAAEHGLILVDTKYEFGRNASGELRLIDEVHTPDSSRYWLQHSYAQRFAAQLEPENIDKEFLRLWFAEHSDPYHDQILPAAPQSLVVQLAARYIQLYEIITGKTLQLPDAPEDVHARILRNTARIKNIAEA